ncbi:MAG TPA: hypothetical protein VN408_27610 [Actinoplanes sp.]|nr:hypothetical protein [Actinoplanes sp.]
MELILYLAYLLVLPAALIVGWVWLWRSRRHVGWRFFVPGVIAVPLCVVLGEVGSGSECEPAGSLVECGFGAVRVVFWVNAALAVLVLAVLGLVTLLMRLAVRWRIRQGGARVHTP